MVAKTKEIAGGFLRLFDGDFPLFIFVFDICIICHCNKLKDRSINLLFFAL